MSDQILVFTQKNMFFQKKNKKTSIIADIQGPFYIPIKMKLEEML